MAKLIVEWRGRLLEHRFEGRVPLIEGIRASGAELDLPCGGNHTCGKCRVLMHNPPPPTKEEEQLLSPGDVARGVRLACFVTIDCDASVVIEEQDGPQQIRLTGHLPEFTPDAPQEESSYGFAVDIGTTTVVVCLYQMGSSLPLQSRAQRNSQSAYGADVISRIQHAGTEGVQGLQKAICNQLVQMMADCMGRAGITAREVTGCVVTGNTTMLHLLTGLDPSGIASAPFTPQSLFDSHWAGRQLGLECPVYLPRCPGAYLGADVTCATLAAELDKPGPPALLVDIGTNGEMVLAAGGRYRGCSTAAGPAFEGAGISQGMAAVAGAIDRVFAVDSGVGFTTIGDAPAAGICGSGLMDAVAVMLKTGAIDETGLLQEGTSFAIGSSGVRITQEDIRQVQLAKAAIAAGIDTLLAECGITPQEVGAFYLAGGFGSYISLQSAADIGLLPPQLAGKAVILGNAAASGAALILLSRQMARRAKTLGVGIEEISLSTSARFTESYVDHMLFDAGER